MILVPLLRLFLLLSALRFLGTSLRVDITDAHNGGTPSTIDTGVRDLHSTQSIVDVQKPISHKSLKHFVYTQIGVMFKATRR